MQVMQIQAPLVAGILIWVTYMAGLEESFSVPVSFLFYAVLIGFQLSLLVVVGCMVIPFFNLNSSR